MHRTFDDEGAAATGNADVASSATELPIEYAQRGYRRSMRSYRLIDMAGGEIGIIADERPTIELGQQVTLPDGTTAPVVDVYDDEFGKEGGVEATLVVEEG